MMKRLRIEMSLMPRAAARDVGSSVVMTAVAKTSFLHCSLKKKTEGASLPPPPSVSVGLLGRGRTS